MSFARSAPILRPLPGFDWNLVAWGAPDQPRTEICNYCDAPLRDDEIPLILGNGEGWIAEFCEACQRTHWGFSIDGLDQPDRPRDAP